MDYLDIKCEKNFNEFENLYKQLRAKEIADGTVVSVKGCIHRIRLMSGFAFVILRTDRRLFQCVYDPTKTDFDIETLKEGYYVKLTGELKVEERSKIGYDFNIFNCEIIHAPKDELPFVINKKELDIAFDTKLDFRPISARNEKERAIFKITEGVMQGFRKYFYANNFTEIVAPKIVIAGAEGGSDLFTVDYFGRPAYLAQSPQFYKQMMVGVFGKVFTIGTVFRAEKSHTNRHITEFQGVDFELGYIDSFEDVMLEEARALACVFDNLRENYQDELNLLNVKVPEFTKIPTVKFAEAKALVAKEYKRDFRSDDDLEPEEEKLIGEYFKKKYGSQLVFVTHYPTKKRPFYAMDDPEDPKYTLSFDLLLNGTEITTGGQRIHDYDMQVAKMKTKGMNVDAFDSYLMIHKYGMPPHGGLGIGLERLVTKLLNLDNIRSATLFPRDTDRLEP